MNKDSRNAWVVLVVIVILVVVSFIGGTIAGFNTAYSSLSDCREVSCSEFNLSAERCEICPVNGGFREG